MGVLSSKESSSLFKVDFTNNYSFRRAKGPQTQEKKTIRIIIYICGLAKSPENSRKYNAMREIQGNNRIESWTGIFYNVSCFLQ